jgi:penicillin amidase/acyl-homoserine-lactone acylase
MFRRAGGWLTIAAVCAAWACGPDPSPHDRVRAAAAAWDVRILRDSWGVPHVFGRRDADAAFGLAYAHAEDDFATIQGSLLAARGALATRLGRRGAPNDYLVGLLRVHDVAAEGYATQLSPETRALVEGYAAGLQLYAELHPQEVAAGVLPFRGEDVVAGFVHKTPLFFGLHEVLPGLMDDEETQASAERANAAPPVLHGSNAFAVAPSRSGDGRTHLAVNSHQPWEGPVAWYEAHVHSDEGWDMVGGVFPGAPVILHGHNRDLGWAFTVNRPDLIDVYALDTHPNDPDLYRFDGEWRRLERRQLGIRVRLLGPVVWTFERELLWSVHGPVVRGPRGSFGIRYAGWGDARLLEQWYAMNRARSLREWKRAMRMSALPSFNAVYADRRGNIFYVYNALLPRRPAGYDWSGTLPGDTSDTLWSEYLAFDELPQVENPPSGFVQNCNSTPFRSTLGPGNPEPDAWPSRFGIDDPMTNRALRVLELFGADLAITAEEFEAYKFDLRYSRRSELARQWRRLLAAPAPDDALLREALERLAGWDLSTHPDDPAAALAVLTLAPFAAFPARAASVDPSPSELIEALGRTARALRDAHGRLDVPWREVNRLRRGALDLGLGGGPDVLHAVYAGDLEDGRVVADAGDSYVLLVNWDAAGRVRSRSIHPFGSATRDEASPHYADQSQLFAERRLKPVWFDEADIRAHLEREYRPGEELLAAP